MFLHGYLADKNSFFYQTTFFERDFDVYAPDFKGFGQNKGMEYPYSLDDYSRELKEYMYKTGIVCPHVIAHSFGARVAINCAVENAKLFDKLVLTGAAGLKPKKTIKKRIKGIAFNVLKRFVKKEKLLRFYSKDYLALDPIMKQSFIKIISQPLDDVVCKIKNQTFIVFGENDCDTPLYMAHKFNREIDGSKLLIIKNAGHFCFIDKPLKFNTEVKEFLLS